MFVLRDKATGELATGKFNKPFTYSLRWTARLGKRFLEAREDETAIYRIEEA